MRVLLSWSGGKDSCMTLVELHRQRGVNVAALGLPLHTVYIPKSSSNRDYEARMEEAFEVSGPLFHREVDVDIGEVIQREVWHFCDLRER